MRACACVCVYVFMFTCKCICTCACKKYMCVFVSRVCVCIFAPVGAEPNVPVDSGRRAAYVLR